jgi:hypothetical protein
MEITAEESQLRRTRVKLFISSHLFAPQNVRGEELFRSITSSRNYANARLTLFLSTADICGIEDDRYFVHVRIDKAQMCSISPPLLLQIALWALQLAREAYCGKHKTREIVSSECLIKVRSYCLCVQGLARTRINSLSLSCHN